MKPHWTDHLTHEVYERLCNCATRKSDLQELANAKWLHFKEQGMDKRGYTKEDALIAILELLDSNGQFLDLTIDEYNELK